MSQATLGSSAYRNSGLFSGYYLDDRIDDLEEWECDTEAEAAFTRLTDLWESERDLLSSYKEDELLGSWIDEILAVLGYDTLQETTLPGGDGYNDRLLFESTETRRKASRRKREDDVEGMYSLSSAILEAKQYEADFSEKFDERRSYHDASHQIRFYLDRAGGQVDWGILTNGKQWRLYGTKDYETEIYYEVDLESLLRQGNLEEFKYFYAFFRPKAFQEFAGTTFLDTVWNESETAAQELGEDLQDNVFTALRILGEGFVETNDLQIGTNGAADIDADELKEQSLVLLYRLMFVLYAESRGLMQPDDPENKAEYDENFSLNQLRLEIDDRISSGDTYADYSSYSTRIWSRLQDLFSLVDSGDDNLEVPPYNGGLFDDEEHRFLAENEVSDPYITEVIHRLGTTETDNGESVLADYADLDTRHLGTIYEGLLEHKFQIAPEQYAAITEDGGQIWKPATEVSVANAVETVDENGLYVVNDKGERKATGAYYTPDYVVSYIVEETIDPLLDDIRSELDSDGLDPSDPAYFGQFYSQLLDLKILDPAMGSAHFLTSATGYLTEQVMEIVREQELQGRNEQELRRTIAKECIYGVDINGMAVELGKLSMWLETLAADKPLAFLDHHIKTGNSLVGSDITEVLSEDNGDSGGQLTLTQSFARARQQTLGHVMGLMTDLLAIDNDELADIKSMEELYDEIRADPLYQRLFELANVHTAAQFGANVPDGVYEEMASTIDHASEWEEIRSQDWFAASQAIAEEQGFFHWELEYPEVFFNEDGEKLAEGGFDAVVGNPPYGMLQPNNTSDTFLEYLNETYTASDFKIDLYILFSERTVELAKTNGRYGLILPNTFILNMYAEEMRNLLLEDTILQKLLVSDDYLFEDADVHNAIIVGTNNRSRNNNEPVKVVWKLDRQYLSRQRRASKSIEKIINKEDLDYTGGGSWNVRLSNALIPVFDKIKIKSEELGNISEVNRGLITGNSEEYISEESKNSEWFPMTAGGDVSRYYLNEPAKYVLFDRPSTAGGCWDQDVQLEENKILIRQIGTHPRASIDTEGHCFTGNVFSVITDREFDPYTILGIINSSLIKNMWLVLYQDFKKSFTELKGSHIEEIPISSGLENEPTQALMNRSREVVENPDHISYSNCLSAGTKSMILLTEKRNRLNLSLLDHLGSYNDGVTLSEIGFSQPPRGTADSVLQQTATEKPNLRVGRASVVQKSKTTVEIQLTARYKPDNEDSYDTDRWGYTETDPKPALRITDLTETEASLIQAFVPVAVDEAGGFANFRETATKTNSLTDRLHKLTLPAVTNVETGLESYMQTKQRAEELERKIQQTDDLIDEIVYELYGLTDEEIEIVEEAVSE